MRKIHHFRLVAIIALVCYLLAACGGSNAPVATTTQAAIPPANPPQPVDPATASASTTTTAAATTAAATTAAAGATTTAAATTATAAATEATTAAVADDDIWTPYGRYPETITITTVKGTPANPNFFLEPNSIQDNGMTRYVLDKINVQIELAWEVASENRGFANRLALQIAANDLPDMFTLGQNDYILYRQLVENNMLADLSQGYEFCVNDHVRNTLASYEGRNLAPFWQDGKLLAFAGGRYGYEHNQLWYRRDWLDRYDLEAPSSIEDMEHILRVWKDDPPTEDYVGFILHHEIVGGVYQSESASPLFASFGSFPNAWVKGSDGQTVWGSVAPETKDGLEVLARWYAEGLLDRQFMTRTAGGTRMAMVVAGQTGMYFNPWWSAPTDFPAQYPDGEEELLPVNAPLDQDGNFTIMFPGAAGDFIMIRNGYPHPEAMFKIVNLEFDMWRGFDMEAYDMLQEGLGTGTNWGYLFPTGGMNVEPQNVVPNTGIYYRYFVETGEQHPDAMPSVQRGCVNVGIFLDNGKKGVTGWGGYYQRYIASSPEMMLADNVKIKLPEYYYVTESMAEIKPTLDTLESTTFLQIITGELPLSAFDDFVEQWYTLGGQTITDEVRSLVGY